MKLRVAIIVASLLWRLEEWASWSAQRVQRWGGIS